MDVLCVWAWQVSFLAQLCFEPAKIHLSMDVSISILQENWYAIRDLNPRLSIALNFFLGGGASYNRYSNDVCGLVRTKILSMWENGFFAKQRAMIHMIRCLSPLWTIVCGNEKKQMEINYDCNCFFVENEKYCNGLCESASTKVLENLITCHWTAT